MNFKKLMNNMSNMGFWGVLTLYHMAYSMLFGLFLFFFPRQVASHFLKASVYEDVMSATVDVLPHITRMLGVHLVAVGLLFRVFGSVTDPKARNRVAIFALCYSSLPFLLDCYNLYISTSIFAKGGLLFTIFCQLVGMVLCCTFFVLQNNHPDRTATDSRKKRS
ncbi:hypothetical protein QOT17_007548 [Balamuthia mandrillaris]